MGCECTHQMTLGMRCCAPEHSKFLCDASLRVWHGVVETGNGGGGCWDGNIGSRKGIRAGGIWRGGPESCKVEALPHHQAVLAIHEGGLGIDPVGYRWSMRRTKAFGSCVARCLGSRQKRPWSVYGMFVRRSAS